MKAVALGLLCLGLANVSAYATDSIETQAIGASQMFDLAVPHMAMGKNQNSQAAQTLKGLKNIKTSANKLHLAKAQEKKAAAKCDVTVPGCRESLAIPGYKGTSDAPSHIEGLKNGAKTGVYKGFMIADFPAFIAQSSHDLHDSSGETVATFFGVLLFPLGIAGAIVGGIIGSVVGTADPKAVSNDD